MVYGEVKNIRNLTLIDRLYNLFDTEGGFKEPPQLLPSVQPVVDMHRFNEITVVKSDSQTATDATVIWTVPTGKRWRILAYRASRVNAGDITCTIRDPSGTGISLKLDAGATSVYFNTFNPMELTEGWQVGIIHGTGTSGTLTSIVLLIEMDA